MIKGRKIKLKNKFMQKQPLIYLALIFIIVLIFLGGFYFTSRQVQREKLTETEEGLTETAEKLSEITLTLKPTLKPLEEGSRENVIDFNIQSIDLTKNPKELVGGAFLGHRFIDPPLMEITRIILVDENAVIGIGSSASWLSGEVIDYDDWIYDEFIDVSELRAGDQISARVLESSLELLKRKKYTAYEIRVPKETRGY